MEATSPSLIDVGFAAPNQLLCRARARAQTRTSSCNLFQREERGFFVARRANIRRLMARIPLAGPSASPRRKFSRKNPPVPETTDARARAWWEARVGELPLEFPGKKNIPRRLTGFARVQNDLFTWPNNLTRFSLRDTPTSETVFRHLLAHPLKRKSHLSRLLDTRSIRLSRA